MFIYLINLYY